MLNHKAFGKPNNKTPVVVLHGFLGDLSNWQSVCRALEKSHFLIALDAPNHGGSPWQAACDYEAQAQATVDFIRAQGFSRISLIGHSMGGKTAIKITEQCPELVERLVVVDIALRDSMTTPPTMVDKLASVNIADKPSRLVLEARLKAAGVKTKIAQFFIKSYDPNTGWQFNLETLKMHQQQIYTGVRPEDKVKTRSLFIQGLKSDYVTDADVAEIKEAFTDVQVVPFDSGHWPHIEKRNQMIATLGAFL